MGHPWLVAGTVVAVIVVGVFIGWRIHANRAPAVAVVRKCEWGNGRCRHTYPQHEDNGGPCHGQVQVMQSNGVMDWEPCSCPSYQGVLPPGVGA